MKFPEWTVRLLVDDKVIRDIKVVATNRGAALRKAQRRCPVLTNGRVEWRVLE